MTMTAVEMLALGKALKEKDAKWARDAVVPGTYPVEVVVHLSGNVTVGADTDRASTSSFLSEDFLILALHMAGCTRDRAAEIIERVAAQGLEAADKATAKQAREAMVERYDADGYIRETIAGIKERLPRTAVRGSVGFRGTVEAVASAAAAERVA